MVVRRMLLARAWKSAAFSVLLLPGCGIYGDWVTSVALNRSGQNLIVVGAKGTRAGEPFRLAPGESLGVMGGFSYYVTIKTDAPESRILFAGHRCDGDWIPNDNDAILVVANDLTVRCVRLKDLSPAKRAGWHR